MDPITLALMAASTAMKFGTGVSQSIQAMNIERKNPRPMYQIPDAVEQNLNMARYLAQANMPGQSEAIQGMDRDAANANRAMLETSTNPNAAMLGAASIYDAQGRQRMALAGQAAQYRDSQYGRLSDALKFKAMEQNKKWQWDKGDPYLRAMEAAASLRNAGASNMGTGFSEAANTSAMVDIYKGE